ncbi:MAG TPA: toprim domain-containing protein, partial [Candidatus Paceibacterota bacterium]|nr:toprim domain-containing protein [Candidatus Paceibacterota bacterium]
LSEIFKEFPGIGERQAKRFVYFLMSRSGAYNENLSSLITDLKKEVAQCRECFRFFILKNKQEKLCDICGSANVDSSTLLVVEKDSDLESVKKSRVYNGKYFILGGLVPIVEKNTKSQVRIEELKEKIKKNSLKEIILAFSLSPQGDHTDSYVREQIKDVASKQNIKISSLGKGLSTGTELEYSDNDTLKNALKNRQ